MDRNMWRDRLEEALNLSSDRLLDDDDVEKIKNYRNKRILHVRRMNRDRQTDRQTATLNYGGTKPKTTSQSTSGLLIGPEQVTWHETLHATG